MKNARMHRRFPRDWLGRDDLYLTQIIAKESELQVFTNKKADKRHIEEKIRNLRIDIENYIERDRMFLISLKPVEIFKDAPQIVKDMACFAKAINAGPMTALAGAIAESLGRGLLKDGFKDVVVQNGSSIFIKSRKSLAINFYTGRSKIWSKLRLIIKPKDTPLGLAIQTATHSQDIAFGCADNVVVLAKNTGLALGVAVCASNRINSKSDLQRALDFARGVKEVKGIAIILKNNLVSWGKIETSS
ncbi:MAG: UPF0280 family protein [Candidatus Omnitrophica bacterium]|nr:UPF0280 family protein [Candidatus Omnitrophota bacterium]